MGLFLFFVFYEFDGIVDDDQCAGEIDGDDEISECLVGGVSVNCHEDCPKDQDSDASHISFWLCFFWINYYKIGVLIFVDLNVLFK